MVGLSSHLEIHSEVDCRSAVYHSVQPVPEPVPELVARRVTVVCVCIPAEHGHPLLLAADAQVLGYNVGFARTYTYPEVSIIHNRDHPRRR